MGFGVKEGKRQPGQLIVYCLPHIIDGLLRDIDHHYLLKIGEKGANHIQATQEKEYTQYIIEVYTFPRHTSHPVYTAFKQCSYGFSHDFRACNAKTCTEDRHENNSKELKLMGLQVFHKPS